MYNYVQEYWKEEIFSLENRLNDTSRQEALELQIRIDWMKGVEMCVVFSQEQKEQQLMEKWSRMFFRTGRRV